MTMIAIALALLTAWLALVMRLDALQRHEVLRSVISPLGFIIFMSAVTLTAREVRGMFLIPIALLIVGAPAIEEIVRLMASRRLVAQPPLAMLAGSFFGIGELFARAAFSLTMRGFPTYVGVQPILGALVPVVMHIALTAVMIILLVSWRGKHASAIATVATIILHYSFNASRGDGPGPVEQSLMEIAGFAALAAALLIVTIRVSRNRAMRSATPPPSV